MSRAFLEHGGAPLHYAVEGNGEPVVLIQGVGVHGDGWLPQVEALASRYRCLRFDHRGIGASPPLAARPTVAGMAGDASALSRSQGWSSAHIVGHSLGGLVALRLALDHPESVRSLALLCTFARGRDAGSSARMMWIGLRTRVGTRRMRRRAFLEILAAPSERAGVDPERLARSLAPSIGHDLSEHPAVEGHQLAAMRAEDASGQLGRLAAIPTLVVSASHDPIAPPALGRALAAGIPGARYVLLENAAHGVPIQAPARINEPLLAHLERATAGRV